MFRIAYSFTCGMLHSYICQIALFMHISHVQSMHMLEAVCINAYVIYYINAYLHACIKCNIDAYISCYIHTNIRCYVHACTISQINAYILDAILKQNAASIHILHTIFILYRMLHLCMHYVIY